MIALRTVVIEDSHMIWRTVVSLLIWVDANPEYETPVNIAMDSPYHRPLPTYCFVSSISNLISSLEKDTVSFQEILKNLSTTHDAPSLSPIININPNSNMDANMDGISTVFLSTLTLFLNLKNL